jgi:hypothetical protein
MNNTQRWVILGFSLGIILIFLFGTLSYYKKSQFVFSTSYASAIGRLEVNVIPECGDGICDASYESCSSCSADCGTCPSVSEVVSGGGGGGGLGREEIIYMLDFNKEDTYLIDVSEGDKIIVVIGESTYEFKVREFKKDEYVILGLDGVSYLISWNEVGLWDFDNDGVNDLELGFQDEKLKLKKISVVEKRAAGAPPNFEKKRVRLPILGYPTESPVLAAALIFVGLISLIGLGFIIYYVFKLGMFEGRLRNQVLNLKRLSKRYTYDYFKTERLKERIRLQKSVLRKAYKAGHIRKKFYNEAIKELNKILKGL